MRRTLLASFALLAGIFQASEASAVHAEKVGLGAAAGLTVPHAGPIDYTPQFDWGFFVDIPLISTFAISPSAIVYNVRPSGDGIVGDPNTDISLNFKFVVPINRFGIYAGLTAGLTMSTDVDPHLGGLAGLSFRIISNLEVFAQANYRIVVNSEGDNRNDLHVFAGPMFRFN